MPTPNMRSAVLGPRRTMHSENPVAADVISSTNCGGRLGGRSSGCSDSTNPLSLKLQMQHLCCPVHAVLPRYRRRCLPQPMRNRRTSTTPLPPTFQPAINLLHPDRHLQPILVRHMSS